MSMAEGWIKLHRKFESWEWFNISEMVHLFVFLLLSANHEDGTWRGINVKRGQVITGLHSLNERTKISIRTLRTCLTRLEKTKEIDIQTTNKYSIITILNYDSYQYDRQATDKQPDKQTTSNRQATDKQPTTNNNNKNDNNEKNEENIEAHASAFATEVYAYTEYPKEMLQKFISYWTEPNKSKTKMKFELERTWDTKRRLNTWASRERPSTKSGGILDMSAKELAELSLKANKYE